MCDMWRGRSGDYVMCGGARVRFSCSEWLSVSILGKLFVYVGLVREVDGRLEWR